MKKTTLKIGLPLLILVFLFSFSSLQSIKAGSLEQSHDTSKMTIPPPPSSLDALYPPQAKEPVWLMRMVGMATYFSGILSDLFQGDMENVMPSYEKFKMQYSEMAKLVPEWESAFHLDSVDELGKALASRDQGKVMAAFEKVGVSCHDCHVQYMTPVQVKYHWGNYRAIKVKDPLTQEEVDFARLMQSGLFVDMEQNQLENCKKQLQGFRARFDAMIETCQDCHGVSERKYYVDEEVLGLFDKLEKVFDTSPFDPEKAMSLGMAIGTESCHKCHLVHGPSALAHLQWKGH
jgi:cytochrome c556